MSEKEFIKQRCEIDKITLDEFKQKYCVVKCECGKPFCNGYRALNLNDLYKEYQELQQQIDDAIEYIETATIDPQSILHYRQCILSILKGKEV